MIPEADIEWSKRHFASLRDGAAWGVPRSGLMFHRKGDKLVLIARMPYTPEMSEGFTRGRDVPPTPTALANYQQRDFERIAATFRAAGVVVEDETPRERVIRNVGFTS